MKKIVIILVIVLLATAGWAGATYVIGSKIEKRYQDGISRFDKWGPFHLVSENYQRGFLSSTGRTLVECSVPVPADKKGDVENRLLCLTFEHKFSHGPLPVGAGAGSFSMVPRLASIETRLVGVSLDNGDGGKLLKEMPWLGEISLLTSIGFNGGGHGQLVVPAIKKTIKQEQFTINWGGFRGDTKFSKNLADLAGNLEMASLQFTAKDCCLQWDGVRSEFDLHEAFPLVYLGRYQAESGPLELAFEQPGKGRRKLRIEGLGADSLSSQKDKTVEYLQSFKVAKIAVDDVGYGPAEVAVAFRGLNGDVLSRYQQDMLDIYGQELLDPEALTMRMFQVYLRFLTGLAEGSPEIEFTTLQLTTPDGEFSGSLRLKLHGEAGEVPSDIPTLLKKLEGQAQLMADESLVRSVMTSMTAHEMNVSRKNLNLPRLSDKEAAARAGQEVEKQLEALIGRQLIERNGGTLRSKARLDHGELKVNGRRLM